MQSLSVAQKKSDFSTVLSNLSLITRGNFSHLFFVWGECHKRLICLDIFHCLNKIMLDRIDEMLIKDIQKQIPEKVNLEHCMFFLKVAVVSQQYTVLRIFDELPSNMRISSESFWISGFRDRDDLRTFISSMQKI